MAGVLISMSPQGMPTPPESYSTTQYANATAAIAAFTAGPFSFLPVTLAASPNTAPGGPPSPESIYLAAEFIYSIVNL